MRHTLGMAAASVVLTLTAASANAAQMTGTIDDIDRVRKTLTIDDTIFNVSPQNTVGLTLDELQEGEEVEIFYSTTQTGMPVNAMTITGADDAGQMEEAFGSVEDVDAAAGTFVVDRRAFVIAPGANVGVELDELEEGDELIVVYDTADGNEPIEVISISRIN